MPDIICTIFQNQSERIKMQEEGRHSLKSRIMCEDLSYQLLQYP